MDHYCYYSIISPLTANSSHNNINPTYKWTFTICYAGCSSIVKNSADLSTQNLAYIGSVLFPSFPQDKTKHTLRILVHFPPNAHYPRTHSPETFSERKGKDRSIALVIEGHIQCEEENMSKKKG